MGDGGEERERETNLTAQEKEEEDKKNSLQVQTVVF
jgi:hypothetical protein